MVRDYYLGLDVGTNSVGYAVTDKNYKLLKFKGEPMWGAHVFEEGKNSAERRTFRTSRRRLERRKQRLNLVREIFAPEIGKIDERFFIRLQEASLWREDVPATDRYILFSDGKMTDKEYFHKYPTIHHLLLDLMSSDAPHDVRVVYLAVAWLVTHRGHFLNEMDKENVAAVLNFDDIFAAVRQYMNTNEWTEWEESKSPELQVAMPKRQNISTKEKTLLEILYSGKKPKVLEGDTVDFAQSVKLLAGGTVKAEKLFPQCQYESSISLSFADAEDKFVEAISQLGEEAEWILLLRQMYDWALLKDAIKGGDSVSAGKVQAYTQHHRDLVTLKKFVRKYVPEKYATIFRQGQEKLKNYVAYAYNLKSLRDDDELPKGKATVTEFCDYLRKELKDIAVEECDAQFYEEMMNRLELYTFMPKQVNGENRVIPYQLYYHELKQILDNAVKYLPFLQEKDADGYTNRDKLLSIFTFRIPYFVGPLNARSERSWLQRKAEGTIRPWNFTKLVDMDKSEEAFIRRMTNKCTYLPAEDVLPLNSLLYQKFMVLNEINPLKVNGVPITVEAKQAVYAMFCKRRRVTSKAIVDCLRCNGYMEAEDILSGVDKNLHSSLKAYHDFYSLLERKVLTEADVERIIERLTYSEEKRRVRAFLSKEYPQLSDADQKYVANLNYNDFGRLSRRLLTGLRGVCKETGEKTSIMDFLWETNDNLMQILSDAYTFKEEIDTQRKAYYAEKEQGLSELLDDMRIANSVRRSIYRTLDIVKDVSKACGNPPRKIFLEMARGDGEKGVRTLSRREQIQQLYKSLDKEYAEDVRILSAKLEATSDNRLQSEVLYLYFLQLGRSMYSGAPINIENIKDATLYNVDHIYPRCYVKDDSLDNKVLVTSQENGAKGDSYPIKGEVRRQMSELWQKFRKNGLLSEKKYNRLVRSVGFSDEEKMGFIQRQLVETRQSTKALAEIFKAWYPDTELIYVKAGLVSDFRHEFDMLKCRSINDLHHAKDAYLNIVVGNVYNSRFNRQWFKPQGKYSIKISTLFSHAVNAGKETVWQGSEDIGRVRQAMVKNNIHYTRYAFERHGGLFDQMPLKKGAGLIPRKAGLDTEKYGGYNKATASFYILTRYILSGKKPQAELMLVPITLAETALVNSDLRKAASYVKKAISEIIGKDIELITDISFPLGMRHIKINTMLCMDGVLCCIAGKDSGGKMVLLKSLMPFKVSAEMEQYIKKLESFSRKKEINRNLEVNEEFDGINHQCNEDLYTLFVNKTRNSPYNKIKVIADLASVLETGRDTFISLTLTEQVMALLSILSVFYTGRSGSCDLSLVGGAKNSAIYKMSAKLSNWLKQVTDARIIDTTASGLYTAQSSNLLEFL